MPPRLNPRSYAYCASAAHLEIASIAEMELCLEGPGALHRHDEHQVVWPLEEAFLLEVGEERRRLGPGMLGVIGARVPHRVLEAPGRPTVRYLDLRVASQPAGVMARHLDALARRGIVHDAAPERVTAAAEGLRALIANRPHVPDASLLALVWQLLSSAETPPERVADPGAQPADPRLRFVEAMMREKLVYSPTVAHLAARAHLSTSQLTRLYREQMNVTPAARLRQLQIEKAAQLLRGSTLSVKQVSMACGFANPRHFCRVFRNEMESTPTEYRRQAVRPAPPVEGRDAPSA